MNSFNVALYVWVWGDRLVLTPQRELTLPHQQPAAADSSLGTRETSEAIRHRESHMYFKGPLPAVMLRSV